VTCCLQDLLKRLLLDTWVTVRLDVLKRHLICQTHQFCQRRSFQLPIRSGKSCVPCRDLQACLPHCACRGSNPSQLPPVNVWRFFLPQQRQWISGIRGAPQSFCPPCRWLLKSVDVLNHLYPAVSNGLPEPIALFLSCRCWITQHPALTQIARRPGKRQFTFHAQ